MKTKTLLLSLALVSGCFFSCHGNNSQEAANGADRVEAAPNEVAVAQTPQYKVVDGRIIPVSGRPMIIDFSATWCGPCHQLKPIFEKLAEEFRGRVDFLTIDVDEHPELAQAYGVQSIPMMFFINKDGQIQNSIVGFHNRDQLLAAINTYFGF